MSKIDYNELVEFVRTHDEYYVAEFMFADNKRIAELEQQVTELKSKYEDCVKERLENRMDYLTMKNMWLKVKQELAELKEKDNYHLRYELAGADETITNLRQQLTEKDIRIEELEGQFAYECECNMQLVDLQKQLEEKDKEIEKLKQQYTILENENGKLAKELIVKNYKKAQKEVSFGIQLAIQELEKVKNFVDGRTYCADYINKRIQDLKGE